MDQSNIEIHISDINRINDRLSYFLDQGDEFYLDSIDPEFDKIHIWMAEIQQYWRETKCPKITAKVLNMGTFKNLYRLQLSRDIDIEIRGIIDKFLYIYRELISEIQSNESKSNAASGMNFHYNSTDYNTLTEIYKKILHHGFVSSETTLEQWMYIASGSDKLNTKIDPICWQGTQHALTYLIHYLFNNSDNNLWVKAENVFISKKSGKLTKYKARDLSSRFYEISCEGASTPKGLKKLRHAIDI